MDPNVSTPSPMPAEPQKKNNTPLIIAVVVVLVLCCCCALIGGGYYLYQNGDQLFNTGSMLLRAFA